ncbi:rhamnogalacturonan acetylesterase [Xanthomonas sp. 4461]|uniref:rhamnogalacturonan acetylesterase n=1 Tax=Xanthomonas sp. 4461 TaxID=3035313 RepID=UPI00216A649D|nr:rhamnogalacturonan acetylesterase [Xanthomonas sp. 4461]MCS3809810.1 lysophospholipase L1-like esterase [Xanthomonas sp. 4461]
MRCDCVVSSLLLTALAVACLPFADAAAAALVDTPRASPASTTDTSRNNAPAAAAAFAASKIVLVGDSTTAVQGGWGPSFCAQHVTSFLSCVNLARGGRSTSNYRAEGSWGIALKELRSGGYQQVVVLIQFGHNDQPGKPGRSTDLATEFPANLRRYVAEARAAGAVPVLVTPLTRRQFERGQLLDDLGPWAEATRAVARELQVPLIDLHARSRALVQGMGPVLAMRLAQRPADPAQVLAAQAGTTIGKTPAQTVAPSTASTSPSKNAPTTNAAATAQDNASAEPMGQAKLAFDYTHLGPDGADLFAAIMADELAQQLPALRPLLIP